MAPAQAEVGATDVAKSDVVAAVRASLDLALAAVEKVAAMARDEVNSDQTRAEGQYDTRATEASYLARGQAWRVMELRRLRAWFELFDPDRPLPSDVVQVGALVGLEGEREELVFVAPVGGDSVVVNGRRVRVISPVSPLGQAMVGCALEEAFEVDTPRGIVDYEIVALS